MLELLSVKAFKDVQLLNAALWMVFTPAPMVTEDKPVQPLKAVLLISDKLSGMTMDFKDVQPEKTLDNIIADVAEEMQSQA